MWDWLTWRPCSRWPGGFGLASAACKALGLLGPCCVVFWRGCDRALRIGKIRCSPPPASSIARFLDFYHQCAVGLSGVLFGLASAAPCMRAVLPFASHAAFTSSSLQVPAPLVQTLQPSCPLTSAGAH